MRLFEVYKIAYLRDVSYKAWYNGMYGRLAMEIGAKNAMITKKSDHIDDWVDYKDPCENMVKPKITKENVEQEFRKQQVEQQAWLFR